MNRTARDATWQDAALPREARVDALLTAMTLDEKIAQLGSAWVDFDAPAVEGGDVAPLESTFGRITDFGAAARDGVGHITRPFGTGPVEPAEGLRRLRDMQRHLVEETRLGIPAIAHDECLTGFTTFRASVYPTPLACAATFDAELVESMGHAIGSDMRGVGVHQGLSPVLDVVRDYRWGRVEETLGEDPHLVAVLATAYVRGMESADAIATLKHFAGYSASRGARNHAPVSIGRRELADVILPPFEMAVRDGGARSVMNSYTDTDGVPAAADHWLLTEVLRDQWGFEGTVVSDYWAVVFLQMMHRVAESPGDAAALALAAGLDVELPNTFCYGAPLTESVRSGGVAEELVDRAVRRVLSQKADLGMLDADWFDRQPWDQPEPDLDSPANRDIARRLAETSVVLLDNPGAVLPLPVDTASIAVVGPCADDPHAFFGCYAFPNHVLPQHPELYAAGPGIPAASLRDALTAEFPAAQVTFAQGCPVREPDRSGFDAAVAAARAADVCVLAVGDRSGLFGRGTSGEGCDAADLALPGVQDELVDAILGTGTPVVLVVVSGRPYALGAYTGRAAAIVQAFFPGAEGGPALAGVLSGRVNPSGRLPVQIPVAPTGSPHGYLQPPLGGHALVSGLDTRPAFPFGHGISYTQFAYSDATTSAEEIPTDGEVRISCRVQNSGDRTGTETVQLYLDDPIAQVVRPTGQLAGFARVTLAPGESAEVAFRVHADRTAFTGLDGHRIVEPGDINLTIAASHVDVRLSATVRLTGATRRVGHDRVMVTPAECTPLPL